MEVGVDFLRITRVLREQTDNPRLLSLYDDLEFQMREGKTLPEAMESAPDVFSPFAISIIERGEVRGDLQGAWHRLADHLKIEAQQDVDLGESDAPLASSTNVSTKSEALPAFGAAHLLRVVAFSGAILALFLALVQSATALNWVSSEWATAWRWLFVAACCSGLALVLTRASNPKPPTPFDETPEDDPFAL